MVTVQRCLITTTVLAEVDTDFSGPLGINFGTIDTGLTREEDGG